MIGVVLGEYLSKQEQLTSLLTTYGGEAAIFQQICPSDTDELWDAQQFPRILYDIDKSGDDERKISGMLYMDIVCSENSTSPESIEKVLKELTDGYFFVVDGMTFAAKWERSDGFKTEPNHKVFGVTVTFSLLAFPKQNTAEPDTVALMNTWAGELFPNATILNVSETASVFKPTDEAPAIYWSFRGLKDSPIPSVFHCTWIQNNLTMHVMAPSETIRNAIVTQAMQELAAKTRVLFPDKSQFIIHSVAGNMSADPIKTGQLTVSGSYGLLRQYPASPAFNNAKITQK